MIIINAGGGGCRFPHFLFAERIDIFMEQNKIGDYIHYSAAGYNKYGIYKKGSKQSSFYNYNIQKQNLLNRIESMMTFQDKTGMEAALNKLLSSEDRSKIDNEAWNIVLKKMEEEFGSMIGKINMDTGNISSTSLEAAKKNNEKMLRANIAETDTYLKTIYNRLNTIQIGLSQIKDKKKYREISDQINMIFKLLNQIIQDGKSKGLTQGLRTQTIDRNMKLSISNINKYTTGGNGEGDSILTIINNLLKNADLFNININLQKGTLFEYLIAAAPAVAKVEAGNALEKNLEKNFGKVLGGQRDKVTIDFDKNNFLEGLDTKSIAAQISQRSTFTDTSVTYGYSQGKIDVLVQWGNQTVPISAKNVKLSSGYEVHLVSGTSLLYLLQDEDNDFVNNYFNVIADHPDGKVVNMNIAHEVVKMTILFKALTGKTFGRDSDAEVFIINDNTTGRVRVFDMKDLLIKAYNNLDAYSKIDANKGPLESLSIANRWANTYQERINNFIVETIKVKINAALKPNIFT